MPTNNKKAPAKIGASADGTPKAKPPMSGGEKLFWGGLAVLLLTRKGK